MTQPLCVARSYPGGGILVAVEKSGYKFATAKPLNSINVILYGKKPNFNNADGKFSPKA
jgi:hypothetical protein